MSLQVLQPVRTLVCVFLVGSGRDVGEGWAVKVRVLNLSSISRSRENVACREAARGDSHDV